MAKALNVENSDQCAAWRKPNDEKSGEKYWSRSFIEDIGLTKDTEEVWWRSLFNNVGQEGSDSSWNLRRPVW